MKKIFSFGAIAAAVMAFAGCTQEIEQPEVPQQEGVAYELVAEVSTKTVNDGMSTKWAKDDALNVFFTEAGSDSYGSNNQFTIVDVEEGKFEGTLTTYPDPAKNYDWYVIYPYDSYVKTPASTNSGYLYIGGRSDAEQQQSGVDNMTHIAGKNYPLYGKLLANSGATAPSVELSHASALLKVVVKNNDTEPMDVASVSFTAPVSLVGTFYLDVTGDDVVYNDGQYVSSTANLKVSDAQVPAGRSAAFYLAVKPFTAEIGAELTLAVNGNEGAKTVTLEEAKTFKAGEITTLNYTVETAVAPPVEQEVTVAEFLAAEPDETTKYILKGQITSVTNTTYGNFYLNDGTGEVLIYGLCSPEGVNKYWAESGAKVGDTIKVKTALKNYNGTLEGFNAIFMELVPFSQPSEWGIVGDLTSWGESKDIPLYTIYGSPDLFVAYNVEIASGAIKVRADNAWNDAKNYGLEVAGKIEADKYYTAIVGAGSQNATPMAYGTYDVYFDLANKRLAIMTTGKSYSEAVDGGDPIVVVEGLADHEWGIAGSFQGWKPENAVEMVVDGDYAVAENVQLATNDQFKFVADYAWTLSYGSACDVNVDETYTTYNNGDNMKFVGEAGAYNIYFSLVTAEFYMEPYVEGGAEPKFVKVTSMDDITDEGSYLLVYEVNSTSGKVFAGKDAATGSYTTAEINDSVIEYDENLTIVNLIATGNGYAIKVGNQYISGVSGSNKINFGSSPVAITISFEADGKLSIFSNDTYFVFNSNTNNGDRFRFYKKATVTGTNGAPYVKPYLYKLQ